jgi:outer membrane lipoprotein-sorting protein
VLQLQDAADKPQTKMWVREDYGLPVRVEVTALDGQKTVIEYKNLKVGAVPAENFQLPAGVPVTDMSGLINKLPQKP